MSKIITSFKNGLVKTSLIQVSSNPGFRSILRQSNCRLSYLTSRAAPTVTSDRGSLLRRLFEPSKLQGRQMFNSVLDIDKIDKLKGYRSEIFATDTKAFIARLQGYLDNNQVDIISDDDMADLIAITSDESHLDLMEKILEARAASGKAFANWGTSMARVYYIMRQLDRACRNLKDPKFGLTFAQPTSFLIVMQLAYNQRNYAQVAELYNHAVEFLKTDSKGVSPSMITLSIAALTKINTPESLATAEKIFSDTTKDDTSAKPPAKAISLLSYLCLNQGHPAKALEYLSHLRNQYVLSALELKSLIFMELNQYEQLSTHLRGVYERNRLVGNSMAMLPKSFGLLNTKLSGIEDERIRTDLQEIVENIARARMVGHSDLEHLLFMRVVSMRDRDRAPNQFMAGGRSSSRFMGGRDQQGLGYNDRYDSGRRGEFNDRYDSGRRGGFNDRYNSGGRGGYNEQYDSGRRVGFNDRYSNNSGRSSWQDTDDLY